GYDPIGLFRPTHKEAPMTRRALVLLLGLAGCTADNPGAQGDMANGGGGDLAGADSAVGIPDFATGCPPNQKMCNGGCVDDDPSHGCAAAACTPCGGGANATPACANGACALQCNVGFGDCDGNASNGC